MAHTALGPICGRESLEKFARRTGGGKVANRQWKAREQQLALLRTAMLCATMRLQVYGTQRYANNDALARGTGGGKGASRPKSHGEWCLKLRLGEHRKTLPHAVGAALKRRGGTNRGARLRAAMAPRGATRRLNLGAESARSPHGPRGTAEAGALRGQSSVIDKVMLTT